ncbi:uncharacterized protein ASPGLDRAFT_664952 [Aspergillus glaucus CBS 516.65]|uniref:Uncharacterized protein n=1 Tax=Aspergillus glaucus CBS 516.65 TaxID=1160497 RepID=A0A1L9VBT4_ASPGL|nr:hypothetical protein ASPGLDRAFT_664952 [Aspergillus glaucus CBS 516.65]OJJ81374.1 hypothetical protein ASPGLDRAFT_664952 [Aspergillus glaucus CBS 516.65]
MTEEGEDCSLVSGLRQERCLLEESFTVQGSQLLWWNSTIFQSCHTITSFLMELLETIAAETRRTDLNNELPLTDGKIKNE